MVQNLVQNLDGPESGPSGIAERLCSGMDWCLGSGLAAGWDGNLTIWTGQGSLWLPSQAASAVLLHG